MSRGGVTWRSIFIHFTYIYISTAADASGVAFALYAEDRGSITGRDRIGSDSSTAKRSATGVSVTGPQSWPL